MGYFSNLDIERHNTMHDRIITDENGRIVELHQQIIPRGIVLLSMAMSFCLAIAVVLLVSILLLGV